jgi:ubiquinone/menaquinone biosynthesis C-methylase UbiE
MKRVSTSKFWNQRYLDNNTKWDLGHPTPILTHYLENNKISGKACVLGCGNGHDVMELSQYNIDVYAIDFATEAIKNLRKKLTQIQRVKLIEEDIFNLSHLYSNYFDFVYEYTCYCAIDPNKREDYFDMVYKILKVGGLLFGIFIPLDKDMYNEEGPPFGVSVEEVMELAHNKFKVIENTFSDHSIEPRARREKLIILEKI